MQRTMLIVDDSRVSRLMIRGYAAALHPDWQFIEAASGEEAVAVASQSSVDLISMDLNMPGINGIEASQKILELQPGTCIVILSANVQPSTRAQAAQMGLRFVAKPVTAERVAEIFAGAGEAHA